MARPSWLKTHEGTFVNPDNIVEIRVDNVDDGKGPGVIADTTASIDWDENLLDIHRTVLYRGTNEQCERWMKWFENNYDVVEFREESLRSGIPEDN